MKEVISIKIKKIKLVILSDTYFQMEAGDAIETSNAYI